MRKIPIPDRIEHWSLTRLSVEGRQARVHSPLQVEQIANSIMAFGFTNPILVNPKGEIIVGYGRYLAAQRAKLAKVPVIVLAHLSNTQQRAYRIADNQLALNATWDEEVLKEELKVLIEEAISIDLLGFSEEERKRLEVCLKLQASLTDEDAVPEPAGGVVSRLADLWRLDDHRLLCGDSTEAGTIRALLGEQEAAMTFTDPPYNVAYEGTGKRRLLNDDLGNAFVPFLEKACRNIVESTAGAIYIAMSSSELHTLVKAFQGAGGHFSTFLIWTKDGFTLGRSDYHRQYEPLLLWLAGRSKETLVRRSKAG